MKSRLFEFANVLYDVSPGAYRLLYTVYKNVSDWREHNLVRSLVKPGMIVLDIGANIGVYSVFLARLVAPNGRVVAVEPDPENFARLCKVIDTRNNIEPVHGAAAAHSGKLQLFLSHRLNVDHHSYDDGEGRQSVEVDAIMLDEHVPHGMPVHFIKMDVQGAELSALKGMERILQENRNIKILFEYWPYGLRRAGYEPCELLYFLKDIGFQLYSVRGNRQEWKSIGNSETDYCNIIAAREVRERW